MVSKTLKKVLLLAPAVMSYSPPLSEYKIHSSISDPELQKEQEQDPANIELALEED